MSFKFAQCAGISFVHCIFQPTPQVKFTRRETEKSWSSR